MKREITRWKKNEGVRAMRRSRLISHTRAIDIRVLPKTAPVARLMVITPRASGNAVQRNLFRRRVRAIFYESSLYQGTNDWLVFAKSGISGISFEQLCAILAEAAQSAQKLSSGT